jgi:NitT/TauT family transport system ATP-binding protein
MLETRFSYSATESTVPILDSSPVTVPKLEVQKLSKTYPVHGNPMTVLQDINLQLYPREFVSIVGASGCGKSTLLNITAGLIPPCQGKVLVDGKPVIGPGSDRGMVFQHYTLYPWLTVAQNIAFGLQFRKMSRLEKQERVEYFLDVVGLTQFANAHPKQLSGGMKQRVAIARALANEPAVLLMDEPLGALDAQTKEQMQQFLQRLWQQTHITIMMITHDVEEAIFLSERVYVMSARPGRIKHEIAVNLPEQRDLDLKLAPEFVEIKRQVLRGIRDDSAEA